MAAVLQTAAQYLKVKDFQYFWATLREFKVYDMWFQELSIVSEAPKLLSLYHFMVDGSTCVYCHKLG